MLHDKMKKLIEQKKQKMGELSDNEKTAKIGVAKHLHDFASGELMKKLGGLKKVAVMSDSQEGLKHGLDEAKHVLEGASEDSDSEVMKPGEEESMREASGAESEDEESPLHEAEESPEMEASEHESGSEEPMSDEEIDAKIKELELLKQRSKK